jgi:4-hydroxy-4-methyl-2-oxoglutarate aldolase
VNIPVSCGDTPVNPGDVIVADNDGVVVVPRPKVTEVLEKAAARTAREEEMRTRYGSGELGIDINNMRPRLAEKGLVYVEQSEFETE